MRRSLNEEAPATLLVIDRSSLNPAHRGQESGRAQVNQGVFVLLTGHESERARRDEAVTG